MIEFNMEIEYLGLSKIARPVVLLSSSTYMPMGTSLLGAVSNQSDKCQTLSYLLTYSIAALCMSQLMSDQRRVCGFGQTTICDIQNNDIRRQFTIYNTAIPI